MEITLNFDKMTISKKVGKFIEDSMTTQTEKEEIRKIMKGNKLQYPAANRLIHRLIAAMIAGDGEDEDDEQTEKAGEEGNKTEMDDLHQTQMQTQTQTQTQTQSEMEKTKPSGSGGDQKTTSQTNTQDQTSRKEKFENVCRFYKNGNCKFGKECRMEHPKFCKKFTKNGLVKHNPQGCDGKCGKLHPNACRESLRTKQCSRTDCRFYHIKGTEVTKDKGPKQTRERENSNAWEKVRKEENQRQPEMHTEDQNRHKSKDQVFLEVTQGMLSAIAKITQQMEEMRTWAQPQVQQQMQPQPQLRPQQQWASNQAQDQWGSQPQRASQFNN